MDPWIGQASAQDGKLVDSSVVTIKEHDFKKLETFQPDIQDILDRVEIKSITYLSDGLKVKGYLAAPKQGEKLPCVIFNRGGNRELGALSDLTAAATLARVVMGLRGRREPVPGQCGRRRERGVRRQGRAGGAAAG